MKLLYAIRNNSKIYNMRRRLANTTIELLTPNDIDVHVEVEENGMTPSVNALKKPKLITM